MTKSELVKRLVQANPHVHALEVELVVTAIFDEIAAALSRGDRVELRGFGAFSVKKRDARVSRNPRTGDSVTVADKHFPFFKTGKQPPRSTLRLVGNHGSLENGCKMRAVRPIDDLDKLPAVAPHLMQMLL